MQHNASNSALSDQLMAAAVVSVNQARKASEEAALNAQDQALKLAFEQMQKVRDFLGNPAGILGSEKTKHGEIAEQLEVGVRRAKDALNGQDFSATFDGVGRTAPMDYKILGIDVQSKFINGVNKTLDHVLGHMNDYPEFGRDGSFYHIPKDLHEVIQQVRSGNTGELSEKTVKAVLEKVKEIEKLTGLPYDDVVKPGISTYSEVQQGKAFETVERHENDLKNENEKLKDQISDDHKANLTDGLKAAAGAAAVGGAVSLVGGLISKYRKEGKKPFKGQLTGKDWKALGLDTAKGAAVGGVTGGVVYGLTNWAGMAAPLAGSFVTAVKGLAPLVSAFQAGEISLDTLLDQGTIVCADVAVVGLCTVAGQALIPIPILGGVIGSIAGKILGSIVAGKVSAAAVELEKRTNDMLNALDASYKRLIEELDSKFDELGNLAKAAFDLDNNKRLLELSVEFAQKNGVPEHQIIKNHDDLFAFINS